jgi:hypothetical protein
MKPDQGMNAVAEQKAGLRLEAFIHKQTQKEL